MKCIIPHITHHNSYHVLLYIKYLFLHDYTSGIEFVKYFQDLGTKQKEQKMTENKLKMTQKSYQTSAYISTINGHDDDHDGWGTDGSRNGSSKVHPYQHIVDEQLNTTKYVSIPSEKGTYSWLLSSYILSL